MRPTRRAFLTVSGGAVLAAMRPSGLRAAGVARLGGPAFGSYWRISLAAGTKAPRLRAAIVEVIASVDAAMSPYRPQSEIAILNRADTRDGLALSAPLHEVVAAALSVAGQTGGAFDPTVGPIVGRYGFGPIAGRADGSYRQLHLAGQALRKDDPALTIDLCGIAKGYALDLIGGALRHAGLTDWMVELGGEVAASGRHPSGRPWQVAIEWPAGDGVPAHVLRLGDGAVATSGDAANSYDLGGRRYCHIIDPRSGAPVDGAIASVSVLAPTAMRADALATALMAMGPQAGVAFASDHRIDALFLMPRADGISSLTTGRFAERLLDRPEDEPWRP